MNILNIYSKSARNATRQLYKNWPFIAVAYIISVLFLILSGFISQLPLGIAGGFLLGAIHLAVITYLYQNFIEIHNEKKLLPKDYKEFDSQLFLSVINTAFPIFILQFAIASSIQGIQQLSTTTLYLQFAIVFFMNPLPETILLKRPNGIEGLFDAMSFLKTHFIEWFIPILLFSLPLLYIYNFNIGFTALSGIVLRSDVLLPLEFFKELSTTYLSRLLPSSLTSLGTYFSSIFILLLSTGIACWVSLFRLELYQKLAQKR